MMYLSAAPAKCLQSWLPFIIEQFNTTSMYGILTHCITPAGFRTS